MRDLTWKTLASKYLFKDMWLTVRADTCERPDGKQVGPYYVYEFTDWVTALAITEDGQVILERQYRHGLGQTDFEIPGGCVDATDANYEDAIARELREETGYSFSNYYYLGKTSANPSTNSNLMHMYLATGGKRVSEQELDENEDIEIHLVSIEELKRMLDNNEIIQSMHVTALYYGLKKLEELKKNNEL